MGENDIRESNIGARNDADNLRATLNKEDRQRRGKLVNEEIEEVKRRREELLSELDGALDDLQNKSQWVNERISRLEQLRQQLQGMSQLDDTEVNGAADMSDQVKNLKEVKQRLHEAHIELAKTSRDDFSSVHRSGDAASLIGSGSGSPTMGELARIGVGLTWPLATAVILAGIAISLVLVKIFL